MMNGTNLNQVKNKNKSKWDVCMDAYWFYLLFLLGLLCTFILLLGVNNVRVKHL